MKIKSIFRIGVVMAGVIVMPGCKPTEKNYKAAYDAALSKRRAEDSDPDLNLPAGGYQRLDEPGKKNINGKSYFYQFLRLKPLTEGDGMKPYNVAVAEYKMPTNCSAQVSDLVEAGYKAFGARSGDDRYFVFVGGYDTLEEAVSALESYVRKNKDAVYVGLPDNPVIIQTK